MKTVFKNIFNQNAMKESKMDNIFRNKLGQHDSGAPDHIWAAIEAKRKKPTRVIPWMHLLGGGAMLLSFGLLIWYFYPTSTTVEIPTAENVAAIADANPTEKTSSEVAQIETAEIIETLESNENTPVTSSIESATAPSIPVENNVETIYQEAVPTRAISYFEKGKTEIAQSTFVIETNTKEETIVQKSTIQQVEKLARLPQLKADLLSMVAQPQLKGPEGCYAFSGGRKQIVDALSFDVLGGMGYAFKNLENTGDPDSDFYLTARDSTEKDWYSFGAGLRANIRYESGLVLRVGASFSQINEIFEIRDGNATETVTTEIRDANGNVIGTETTVKEGELYKKTHNRLRFVDVPVMLGYEWTKKKLTFSANAGASFNLQFTQKGDFLSDQLDPVTFTTDAPNQYDYFKTKIGISYIGSIGMTYQLKDNLDLLVEPQVRYMPTTIGNNNISQRYTDVGLYTGLRYYFVCRKRN